MNKKDILIKNKNNIYFFADNIAVLKILLSAGAKVIQYRDKACDDKFFYKTAKQMIALIKKYKDIILIINDRVDIAIELNADGVHLGSDDKDYHNVIKYVPKSFIVGVSVDNVNEAIAAQKGRATYIGAGSVFSTTLKQNVPIIGLNKLKEIVNSVNIPVVAIGGINLTNIRQVMKAGADYYAIISAINFSKNILKSINEFNKIINKSRGKTCLY